MTNYLGAAICMCGTLLCHSFALLNHKLFCCYMTQAPHTCNLKGSCTVSTHTYKHVYTCSEDKRVSYMHTYSHTHTNILMGKCTYQLLPCLALPHLWLAYAVTACLCVSVCMCMCVSLCACVCADRSPEVGHDIFFFRSYIVMVIDEQGKDSTEKKTGHQGF